MRLLTRKWLCVVLPVLLAAAAVAPASASAFPGHGSPVVGHVYLDDNTAGGNTVAGFDRHADGSLTADPGSPFAAAGAGTVTGLASQGAIQISPDGRFVIAVDAGSNQISVLRIEPDGGRPSRYRRDRSLAPFCSTGTAGGSLGRVGRLRSTASPSTLTDASPPLRAPRSRRRDSDHSGAGSAPPSRTSCSSPTPTMAVAPARVRVRRRRGRDADADWNLALPGPPDRAVLGRDQPRRTVPVHREHGVRHDLPLRDRARWDANAAREYPGQ
jgi:Lactonase, 7-bladed beta-propeller